MLRTFLHVVVHVLRTKDYFLKRIPTESLVNKILVYGERNTRGVSNGKGRRYEEKDKVAVLGWLERKEMRGKEVNEKRREERCK